MGLVTFALIARISGDGDQWQEPLEDACAAWDIDTRDRVAMFLATTAHESAGFRRLVENLKYSPAGLVRTWPTRFTAAQAAEMAYDEVRIAERAYGGRMGNGPEGSGDGYLYRGRGLIQVTGKANYRAIGEHLGGAQDPDVLVHDPALLESPLWAAYASACFWDVNGCSDAADAGDFERVTRIVNGGLTGLEDRRNWLAVVREAM
jgi:putative chitinase